MADHDVASSSAPWKPKRICDADVWGELITVSMFQLVDWLRGKNYAGHEGHLASRGLTSPTKAHLSPLLGGPLIKRGQPSCIKGYPKGSMDMNFQGFLLLQPHINHKGLYCTERTDMCYWLSWASEVVGGMVQFNKVIRHKNNQLGNIGLSEMKKKNA